jgi:hypothetical protein
VKEFHGAAAGPVSASLAECLALLQDVASYPDWYPEVVRRVEVEGPATGEGRTVARTTLHAGLGPLEHDFEFVIEVSRPGPDTIRLARVPNEPTDPERLTLVWRVCAGADTELAVELEALLDVPRLLPLAGAGDAVARGFLAAARTRLDGKR